MSDRRSPKNPEKNRCEKIFVRMNDEELNHVRSYADKFSGGNVSKWMRDRASRAMLDVSIKMQDELDEVNSAK